MTRDGLYAKLKENGILGRRYFYPLISSFDNYSSLESASVGNLTVANAVAESVLCLPLHHELSSDDLKRIITLIKSAV